MTRSIPIAAVIAAAALGYCPAALAQGYTVTAISVPGSVSDHALAVNDSGTVLGEWIDSNYRGHAYTYQAGVVTQFDYPGAIITIPAAINSKGDIAGYYVDSAQNAHGFILKSGVYKSFDDPSAQATYVTGMNKHDVVCGDAYVNSTTAYIFKHRQVTTFSTQGSPYPVAINDKGTVVGNEQDNQSAYAFLYENGVLTSLPNTLGNPYASGLNNKGTVVGSLLLANGQSGFFYSRKGKMTQYDVPGSSSTGLSAINDLGTATGQYTASGGNQIGFVLTGGIEVDLPVAQSISVTTYAISNTGQVAGEYLDSSYNTRSFVAVPQ